MQVSNPKVNNPAKKAAVFQLILCPDSKYSRLAALRFVWASLWPQWTETAAHCGRVSLSPAPARTQDTAHQPTGFTKVLGLFCCRESGSDSPWLYPRILVVTQTAAPPAPSASPSACPPGTSGCSSHCPAVRWTPWPCDTSPPPQLVSPNITHIKMKTDDVLGSDPFYWLIHLLVQIYEARIWQNMV